MKKSEKRLVCIVLVLAIIASALSISLTAFAKSQRLILDVRYSDTMDGSEDLIWYVYTPEVSGTYSFLSFNVPHSEAYLFTKESDALGKNRVLTQIAYSQSSPNYAERGQSGSIQFCLTYHLEAGETYYYAAGWWSANRTGGTMNVMLTCDEYDESSIESIDLRTSVTYDENSNGKWETDSNGNAYFSYDIARLLTNLTVTVHYKDGTSSSVTGKDEIDGNSISYITNQASEHWYPAASSSYSGNVLTVTVLGVSAEFNVTVNESNLKRVSLKIIDYSTKEALEGATVKRENDSVETDADGIAVISLKGGENEITVSDMYSIPRTVTVTVNQSVTASDFTDTPIELVTGDFNRDNVINGKDYAYIMKNYNGEMQEKEFLRFKNQVNFKKKNYAPLVIQ